MSNENKDKQPMLANLVNAGRSQTHALPINDFIYMANDISNAYLINTGDGDVMVNTGFMASAARNRTIFEPVRSGALRTILLTQAHADHYGGVPAFRESSTQIIAGSRFVETWKFFHDLGPYLKSRSNRIWKSTIKGRDAEVPRVVPDIAVEDRYEFEVGKTRFEIIATPGGESPDSVVVWLPDEGIVFTGNLFGPVFRSMPNLCTLRGDKPRSARLWLECLDKVRKLDAEMLITGHGNPVVGANTIRADLDTMHAAVAYVHDKTFEGMNAGKDVFTLMREIQLPPDISIDEYHGKVSWAVRTIWEEYSGWFHMDSTTSLYAVPRSSVNADLVELAGGPDRIAERAAEKLAAGKPLQAMHLLDIALGVNADNAFLLEVKKQVLGQLLQASGGQNLSEVMWLKSELNGVDEALGSAGPDKIRS